MPSAILLDNGFLTDIRTGAAGAIAADVLAPRSIRTIGILGSGLQARYQVDCLRVVRHFSRILAWSPTRQRLDAFCAEMRRAGYEAVAAGGVEQVCREADVLITVTPSRQPLVDAAWLRPRQHVTAVGSDSPGKQELQAGCFSGADVIAVDRYAQCSEFGELKHALDAGLVTRTGVSELGAIVAGRAAGRTSDAQLTIADLTGVGFQDTAIASAALDLL
jgi:ornithine cyclodeaminase